MSVPTIFVKRVDLHFAKQMMVDLGDQGFLLSTPPHTVFSGKKQGVSCTLYTSGKLVVQGKGMREFIEFYLEPLLGNFTFSHPTVVEDQHTRVPHIGIDESGKGDFFGPLCVAGVYADSLGIQRLRTLGVKDSKDLSDAQIVKLAKAIRAEFVHHIVKINPQKYNELYAQFGNLNHLLAWGHATTIEELVKRTECLDVTVDQFANENVVLRALNRKKLKLNLVQRHRAEEDGVVAAASILAREAFLAGLEELGKKFGMNLPKGASKSTIEAGRSFLKKYGTEALSQIGKLHFKTYQAVIS